MTNNYGHSEDSNEGISKKSLEEIDSEGASQFEDFFEYDPKTGLFLKHEKNTWGGREVACNLEFQGLISFEEPITPQHWFSNVLKNLEDALEQK